MSRACQLTGKKPQSGNNVSHSHRKTRRRFLPNIQKISLASVALGRDFTLRISTRALRTVVKKGGLDQFLLQTDDAKLPEEALRLKRRLKRKLSKRNAPAATAS